MADSGDRLDLWMKFLGGIIIAAFIITIFWGILRRHKKQAQLPKHLVNRRIAYVVVRPDGFVRRQRSDAVSAGTAAAAVDMGLIDERGLPRYTVRVEDERYVLR